MGGAPDMGEQQFAGTGQPNATGLSLEQGDSKALFQIEYMPVHRR